MRKLIATALLVSAPVIVSAQALTGSKVKNTYKDLIHANNSNSGVVGCQQFFDGAGTTTTVSFCDDQMVAATGDEYAMKVEATCNKATSDDCYGLYIDITDTASPSDLFGLWVGRGGTADLYVDDGEVVFAADLRGDGNEFALDDSFGLRLANNYDVNWSGTGVYSGSVVANFSMWDDSGGTTSQYWIAADDGGGDALGDGYIMAEEIMVGGQDGVRLTDGVANALTVKTTAGAAYANVYGNSYIAAGNFLAGDNNGLTSSANDDTLLVQGRSFTVADIAVDMATGTASNSSGEFVAVEIGPTVSQTATASATVLKLNATTTAVGSGGMKFISAVDDSSEVFYVNQSGESVPAGGTVVYNGANAKLHAATDGLRLSDDAIVAWDSNGSVKGGFSADLYLKRYDPTTTNEYLEIDNATGAANGQGSAGIIVGGGTTTYPGLGFDTDSDGLSGITEESDGYLRFVIDTVAKFEVFGNELRASTANGPEMLNEASSRTNPIFAEKADINTGISGGAAGDDGETSIISDGVEIVRVDGGSTTGITEIFEDGNNGAANLLSLQNTNEPTDAQTSDTAQLSFYFQGQATSPTYAAHEAARVEAYKVSDWYNSAGGTNEADFDSGLKWYVTSNGDTNMEMELNRQGQLYVSDIYETGIDWGIVNNSGFSMASGLQIKWTNADDINDTVDLVLSRYDPTTTNEYLEIDNAAGAANGQGSAGIIAGAGTVTWPSLSITDSGGGVDGFYSIDANTIGVSINGAARFKFTTTNFGTPASNGAGLVYGSSTRTAPTLFGDSADQNTGISGGAAGDDGETSIISDGVEIVRVDGTEVLFNKTIQLAVQGAAVTATTTLVPTSSYVELTCSEGGGCAVTLSEASAAQGDTLTIVNVGANTSNLADTSGVSELAGAFAMGQYDAITLIYMSDRWVETGRSDN